MLIAAAWLHDIGYAAAINDTGFHSLDGARWLRNDGARWLRGDSAQQLRTNGSEQDDRLAGLIAYHSCAVFEAAERGLEASLRAEFDDERTLVRDALWYADLTTGPDGQPFTALERLAEIRTRYGPDHLVTRMWQRAEPHLMEVVERVERRRARPMRKVGLVIRSPH